MPIVGMGLSGLHATAESDWNFYNIPTFIFYTNKGLVQKTKITDLL